MTKNRLEAFSDGVIAILITIMVLELRPPHGGDVGDLRPLAPVLGSYALSFVFLGIYWNNHHHMLHAAQRVDGRILWANLHLLFWLSLVPFVTAWMGENHFSEVPVALYGAVMLAAGCAYYVLAHALAAHHGPDSALARALGTDVKGKISIATYAVAMPLSFANRWIALALYVAVALMWFVPDRRMERVVE
jgi:TMEM175 potassium channel family protein